MPLIFLVVLAIGVGRGAVQRPAGHARRAALARGHDRHADALPRDRERDPRAEHGLELPDRVHEPRGRPASFGIQLAVVVGGDLPGARGDLRRRPADDPARALALRDRHQPGGGVPCRASASSGSSCCSSSSPGSSARRSGSSTPSSCPRPPRTSASASSCRSSRSCCSAASRSSAARGTILGVVLAAFVFAGLRSALLLTSSFNENDFQVVSGGLLILSVLIPNVPLFVTRGREPAAANARARRRRPESVHPPAGVRERPPMSERRFAARRPRRAERARGCRPLRRRPRRPRGRAPLRQSAAVASRRPALEPAEAVLRHARRARARCRRRGPLDGIGVDSWGVDYALLDGEQRLLGLPFHYRDPRGRPTTVIAARVRRASRATSCTQRTGIQTMPINTVFQLIAERGSGAACGGRARSR